MGIFKLPFGLLDELTKLIRDFWWGAENGKRKTHWISWDSMWRPKDEGGMGFKDMRLSTKPFWPSRHGTYCRTLKPCVPKY
jgi:hypothetical protein